MRRLILWTAAIWTTLGSALAAQDNPVVVELFTSQGCSSCPPADALLADLAEREDVITLALHVDYWDYIGWKDPFARPEFTRRQRGYARSGGWRRIYTPQMVINGSDDVVGSRPMKVAKLIQDHSGRPAEVRLEILRTGGALEVRAEALSALRPCDIHIVRYDPAQQTRIRKGENAGRTLTYTSIVEDWALVDRWDGTGTYEGRFPLDGDAPVVVIVQEPRFGHIVAAARLR
ncbi:DUF1223 domain-containing protein [Pseudoponticoccus marisrubri]|uniref:DUF1223 domain-containing protein n=1 Tax=Pseudoponticoccus marisrubri TaxID=1685382 RepID=A0A0W7WM67_9RHOB|nr:DUF1223 domain-containing protein [Pseudoponticoccus marisrubri]KUF11683.1 hypothetical protein AVJ23_06970 [Pseudoponticoccus marisrubri]